MYSESTTSNPTKAGDIVLLITYVNIALYALCYQLQRPVEPFLIKSLTEDHTDPGAVSRNYGRLEAFFSAIQTVGSPLVGILLDRVGIRKTSALVFLSSALSYGILSQAHTMPMLFFSKVPTALQHAFLVAQATAATSTANDPADRAQALGRMTTAYTVGATIGPALGGYLAGMGDLYLGAKMAIVGSLISVVLSMLFLPNQHAPTHPKDHISNVSQRGFIQELQHSYNIALRSNLWPLLVVKVVGGFAASMHSTALPMVLTQRLGFQPSQLGLSMSTSMFTVAAFGAVAMAPLAKWLGPPGMSQIGLLARALLATSTAMIITTSVRNSEHILMLVIVSGVLHALASHMLSTGLTTQTTGAVDKTEQGALLGLEHGLFSLARIGAPPLGTTLLGTVGGFWTVAIACGSVDIALITILISTAAQTAQIRTVKIDEVHSE